MRGSSSLAGLAAGCILGSSSGESVGLSVCVVLGVSVLLGVTPLSPQKLRRSDKGFIGPLDFDCPPYRCTLQMYLWHNLICSSSRWTDRQKESRV